jgi:hypothetical protein
MPAPRQTSAFPSPGERKTRCTLQYATPSTDAMGGTAQPSWTDFGQWWAKVNVIPVIPDQTKAVLLYDVEGPYRADLITKFLTGVGLRVLAAMRDNAVTLTVLQVEDPLLMGRTLIAHCAVVTT